MTGGYGSRTARTRLVAQRSLHSTCSELMRGTPFPPVDTRFRGYDGGCVEGSHEVRTVTPPHSDLTDKNACTTIGMCGHVPRNFTITRGNATKCNTMQHFLNISPTNVAHNVASDLLQISRRIRPALRRGKVHIGISRRLMGNMTSNRRSPPHRLPQQRAGRDWPGRAKKVETA